MGLLPGVAGEVYVGGGGVARGYLNRPELTAERFVPIRSARSREAAVPDGGSGALAGGGELEFLGRADDQVKIRGFRVELGEIEAALRGGPGIEAAAVVVREDAGDRRLVAYVVRSAGDPDPGVLRGWLAERLPSYMLPSAFVSLAALPRTANGKLNRAALPAPREAQSPSFVAPRTPVEEMVASLWSGLLGWESVGVGDDFRAGRALAAGHATARPPARGVRRGDLPAIAVRRADCGRLGPQRGGGDALGRTAPHAPLAAGAARWGPPPLLRPAAALVPRSDGAGKLVLQHPLSHPSVGAARRGCHGEGPDRDRAAP